MAGSGKLSVGRKVCCQTLGTTQGLSSKEATKPACCSNQIFVFKLYLIVWLERENKIHPIIWGRKTSTRSRSAQATCIVCVGLAWAI